MQTLLILVHSLKIRKWIPFGIIVPILGALIHRETLRQHLLDPQARAKSKCKIAYFEGDHYLAEAFKIP